MLTINFIIKLSTSNQFNINTIDCLQLLQTYKILLSFPNSSKYTIISTVNTMQLEREIKSCSLTCCTLQPNAPTI